MNSKAFIPEEVEKGIHFDLINYLLDYNSKSEYYYYDIHITTDGFCVIVEWENLPYDGSYGGRFEYVEEDQYIMTEKQMPDDTYIMVHDEDEYNELLDEFLKENPGYYKNEWGRWCNEEDVKIFNGQDREDED